MTLKWPLTRTENRNLSRSLLALTFLLGIGSMTTATAQTGSEGYFEIHNNTRGNVVIGFYTNDGSGWSENWLDEDLMPGETASAEFLADTGACDQTFQVGWLGENDNEVLDEPINIDICDASNVYLDDNEIFYD